MKVEEFYNRELSDQEVADLLGVGEIIYEFEQDDCEPAKAAKESIVKKLKALGVTDEEIEALKS